MKKIFLCILSAALLAGCQSKEKKADANNLLGNNDNKPAGDTAVPGNTENKTPAPDPATLTTLEWIDPVNSNLGKLVKDQSVEVTFRFKNTGTKPLVIADVSAGCGCTIPEKPEKPVAPGEEGVIRAKYDGRGSGHISKSIFVKANTTPADHTLTFEGDIKE